MTIALIWLALTIGRKSPRPVEALEPIACARCGRYATVRCVRGRLAFLRISQALCLGCGERWDVEQEVWDGLPWPRPGDPHLSKPDFKATDEERPLGVVAFVAFFVVFGTWVAWHFLLR